MNRTTKQPVKLYAQDIAIREGRSVEWARSQMNALAFGELVKINARLMYVYETGYDAWKQATTRVFIGSAGGPRVARGCAGRSPATLQDGKVSLS